MVPEIGQRFGPYEILGKLGGGGMGFVFRAWDRRLHREVAVKLLNDEYGMPGMRERFLQEARAASALNHPNICTVFDIGEQDHNPYLVMELLEGETVKDRIVRGAVPADEIVHYAMEIADALDVANSRGIVHRDIKPANIFLVRMPSGQTQAKVLDFGLAKIGLKSRGGWESRALDLTLAGATVGTLAYMSPEQARGESLDIRSDMFSLGIVLYEMATKQVPFRGATSALLFVQLFSHNPEPMRNWNEEVPRELEKVILKLLAKEPKARYQTARELHDALAKAAKKLGESGWNSKGKSPVVPLVRSSDPVARPKGQKRQISEPGPSSGGMMIRPMRVMGGDRGGVELMKPRSAAEGAIAVESGEMPAQLRTLQGAVSENGNLTAHAELTPDQPWSDAMLSGNLLVSVEAGGAKLENVIADESSVQELIAAYSAVSSKTQIKMVVAAALIVIGATVVALVFSGIFRPLVLKRDDQLLLTVMENKTGDKTLDGVAMEALEIALRQSKSLNVLGGEAYTAGLRQIKAEANASTAIIPEQRVAQKVGARAYLYGEIKGTVAPYTVSVDVLKSDSNDKVETLEEAASSREEIPAAIGRLAQDIRVEISEDRKTDERHSVPLKAEATANLNALHAYALGEVAMRNGRTSDAIAAFQQAAVFDPGFAQAQMRLSWLYASERAEVASANAAEMAQKAAEKASDKVKLLAKFSYEINASGDTGQAVATIRQFVTRYPHDIEGIKGLARGLRMQGNLQEALSAAQQGHDRDPFDVEVYTEAELAMIGMDRYDDALQLDVQARRTGVISSGNTLLAGYLAGRPDTIAAQLSRMQDAIAGVKPTDSSTPATYADLYRYGLYLDNTGKVTEGTELWRVSAAIAGSVPELGSTEASLLAQGALDRALIESCTVALEMVEQAKTLPKGPTASFKAGMAAALCGDKTYAEKVVVALQQNYRQNTAVAKLYVPQLQAAVAIGENEPRKGLDSLIALEQYDSISLGPYLRGMANAALGKMSEAVLDFQTVLDHRGLALTLGSNAYPMAEIGVARAYTASHDKDNGIAAYRQLLALWRDADQGQPLVIEALAKSK